MGIKCADLKNEFFLDFYGFPCYGWCRERPKIVICCRGACKAISDFNSSLGSCYFVRIVNERASVASFERALKSAWLIIRFKHTSN